MEKFTEHQKRRIKDALRIMRETSGEKYEIIRDVHRMDPNHIENGESFPTLGTIINYCQVFSMCPGWLVLLSCQVDKGKIKEEEFFEMIKNWKSYMQLAEMKMDELMTMIRGGQGRFNYEQFNTTT
ncbi:MAG: hypothetical protein D4R64_04340 [Porphyromonadaceae bacterium]|nr:MAG: hypothetical protein D4R64_04340 [Porphyromonadaceae bacterium]